MDITKQPGITFADILLVKSQFIADTKPETFDYKLEVINIVREVKPDPEGKGTHLICVFDFDLMHEVENPPCTFTCSFLARYHRNNDANMTWDEFNNGMALSHVIGFLREYVMNITTRSVLPRIFIPPTNAYALVDRYEKRKAKALA